MKLQILVAAMNADKSIIEEMNIKSDAIIGNQCDKNSIESCSFGDKGALFLNFNERGVGLNRNNALMRATGDICLFADDDMVYLDSCEKTVLSEFEKHPEADVIIFNIKGRENGHELTEKYKRVGYLNFLRYGTARIAIRRKSVSENAIFFNQNFGGGTMHCHGEDNLFLAECLKKGLKVYASPEFIASLTNARASTWNSGDTEKYLSDQGVLYRAISKRFWRFLCLQDAVRRKNEYKMSAKKAYSLMICGAKRGI